MRGSIVETLERLAPELRSECKIELLGLIGSAARNEMSPSSDVDVAYRRLPDARVTLLDVSRARRHLERALARKVDLIDWNAVRQHYRQSMQKDLVALHG